MTENDVLEKINSSNSFLLTAHIRPDGDAVGSLLGLGLALIEIGKDVQMVLLDGVPKVFRYLKGSELIKKEIGQPYDCSIVLDCSDLKRTGLFDDSYQPDIVIDHHVTSNNFGKINFVKPQSCATASMLAEFMPKWDLPITKDSANALLTGIVSDTLGFRISSVTPKTLNLAAGLMEKGANLPDIYQRNLISKSYEAAQYWGYGLQNLHRDSEMVWASLSLDQKRSANYPGNDDADLINLLSSIDDASVSLIFIEQSKNLVKVSWRAKPGFDVSQIALDFGGGGHPAAAGASITGKLMDVKEQVLEKTRYLFNHV